MIREQNLQVADAPNMAYDAVLAVEFVAPYLPYKLKCRYTDTFGENVIGDLTTVDAIHGFAADYCFDSNLKPLLHPLSDLVKEIEHNGNKFMPMLELYKIVQEETEEFEHSEYKTAFTPEIIASFAHILTKDLKHGYQFNYLLPHKSFTLIHSDTREQETISQFELFQKLFEWHFDIFELIPKGLAEAL